MRPALWRSKVLVQTQIVVDVLVKSVDVFGAFDVFAPYFFFNLSMPSWSLFVPRGITLLTWSTDSRVTSMVQEQVHNFVMTTFCCKIQRSHSTAGQSCHISTVLQQKLCNSCVTVQGCPHQRSHAIILCSQDICAMLQQQLGLRRCDHLKPHPSKRWCHPPLLSARLRRSSTAASLQLHGQREQSASKLWYHRFQWLSHRRHGPTVVAPLLDDHPRQLSSKQWYHHCRQLPHWHHAPATAG